MDVKRAIKLNKTRYTLRLWNLHDLHVKYLKTQQNDLNSRFKLNSDSDSVLFDEEAIDDFGFDLLNVDSLFKDHVV